MSNRSSMLAISKSTRAKGFVGADRLLSVLAGLIAGILAGLFVIAPPVWQITGPTSPDSVTSFTVDTLSPDDLQALILKALTRLGEQRGLATGAGRNTIKDFKERQTYSRKDIEHGLRNMRRLLPSVKRWTLDAIRKAAAEYNLKESEWPRVTRLIDGVHKIIRSQHLRGMASVWDDRLSEIVVDPDYAPYLASDDEAVFVLAHELTHVAARSNKLDRFIKGIAQKARRLALVEPAEEQWEDLTCDFVGELVLKQFVALNPKNESPAVRVSSVFGYESPVERSARAWEDFCASYNGDPGDDNHLNQYQTIRALVALDPELQPLMPSPGNLVSSSLAHGVSCESQ